jgi:hypothetical protein
MKSLTVGVASSFINFLQIYDVIPELSEEFVVAATLARSATRCLSEAKSLEDVLGKGSNLNRALWAVYGGRWQGPERRGLELEPLPERIEQEVETGSDGGWEVDHRAFVSCPRLMSVLDLRPSAPSIQDGESIKRKSLITARGTLAASLAPLDPTTVKVLGYVPYSRRKVTSVHPPNSPSADEPAFMSKLHRLVTVAAPWTVEERWRATDDLAGPDEGPDDSDVDAESDLNSELEKEMTTITEPECIELWCEADQVTCAIESLIGAGLPGRWALIGVEGGSQWWTFKAKDCEW